MAVPSRPLREVPPMAALYRCSDCHHIIAETGFDGRGCCPGCGGSTAPELSPEAVAAYVRGGADALCDDCGEPIAADFGCCTACGIGHFDPCPECGWRGVHRKGCPALTEGYRRGEQWAVDAVSAKEGR